MVKALESEDRAIVFWDKKSKGTKHLIDLLNKEGRVYKVVEF
jgi:hypothetical protein